MAGIKQSYVSLFKINGIPIVGPLMTEQIRAEMSQYRSAAVAIEKRLSRERRRASMHSNLSYSLAVEKADVNTSTSSSQESCQFLSSCRSDTECEYLKVTSLGGPGQGSTQLQCTIKSNILEPSISVDTTEMSSTTLNEPSVLEQSTVVTSAPVSVPVSPSATELSPQTRIRSNSYTLESPSPLLVKVMETRGLTIQRQHAVSLDQIPILNIDKESPQPKKIVRLKGNSVRTAPSIRYVGKVRNLTEVKPRKPIRKLQEKNPQLRIVKTHRDLSKRTRHSAPAVTKTENDWKQIFLRLEGEKKKRMDDLMISQAEEQQKLQIDYDHQYSQLMQQIIEKFPKLFQNDELISSPTSVKSINSSSGALSNLPQFSTDTFTRKKTSPMQEQSNPVTEAYLKQYLLTMRSQTTPESAGRLIAQKCKRQLSFQSNGVLKESRSIDHAASTIQAYIRGYLTRRIMKTEHVRKIKETINDTLLFTLDLHHDPMSADNIADLKLKNQLLQQLTSACHSLHDVFFKWPAVERMRLIARDRKIIEKNAERHRLLVNRAHQNTSKLELCIL